VLGVKDGALRFGTDSIGSKVVLQVLLAKKVEPEATEGRGVAVDTD
jgi:hypothetical protein